MDCTKGPGASPERSRAVGENIFFLAWSGDTCAVLTTTGDLAGKDDRTCRQKCRKSVTLSVQRKTCATGWLIVVVVFLVALCSLASFSLCAR